MGILYKNGAESVRETRNPHRYFLLSGTKRDAELFQIGDNRIDGHLNFLHGEGSFVGREGKPYRNTLGVIDLIDIDDLHGRKLPALEREPCAFGIGEAGSLRHKK